MRLVSAALGLFLASVAWLMYRNSDPDSFDDIDSDTDDLPLPPKSPLLPVPDPPTPASVQRRLAGFSIGGTPIHHSDHQSLTPVSVSVHSQCDLLTTPDSSAALAETSGGRADRALDELLRLLRGGDRGAALAGMSTGEMVELLRVKAVKPYQLEKELGDEEKAVRVRRAYLSRLLGRGEEVLSGLPCEGLEYEKVWNACAENVIGYVPIPVGYAGPLRVNGENVWVPLATTEGALIASTHRGCAAIAAGSGVRSVVHEDGMTRAATVRFPSLDDTMTFMAWTKKPEKFRFMKQKFEETSRFARLQSVKCKPGSGQRVFIRFTATTGDAMGMNMVSKGTEAVVKMLAEEYFPKMIVVSLSGNYCVDKKAAAINWIEGRGKSVVAEAVIPAATVASVLKTSTPALVELGTSKNLIGSALAATLGGFNAHAANIVTALFAATGQDIAQNVSSSACLTTLEADGASGDLYVSVNLPCLEVGTVGGGTMLGPQSAALELLGCSGGDAEVPGRKACRFAKIVGAAVLAGELSLLAALSSGDLVRSHLRHNRSQLSLNSPHSRDPHSLNSFAHSLGSLAQQSLKGASLHPDTCSKVLT